MLGVGGWSTPRPGRFTPGKDPIPIVQEAECGRVRKIPAPTGIRSPDRPARRESVYLLSHPCPHRKTVLDITCFSTPYNSLGKISLRSQYLQHFMTNCPLLPDFNQNSNVEDKFLVKLKGSSCVIVQNDGRRHFTRTTLSTGLRTRRIISPLTENTSPTIMSISRLML